MKYILTDKMINKAVDMLLSYNDQVLANSKLDMTLLEFLDSPHFAFDRIDLD